MQLESLDILFSNSWRQFKEKFSVIVPIFLIPAALLCVGQILVAQGSFIAALVGGIINFLGFIVSIAASIALVSAIGKGTDFAGSFKMGITLFWGSIWIGLLVGLAAFGGFVMFVIPGIMLGIQLALSSYVYVLEGKRGMNALVLSREYVKGYWWAFFGRMLLCSLIFGVVLLVIYLPLKLILGDVIGGVVYYIITLFLTPFSVCYNFEIYKNLQRLKPGAADEAAKGKREFLFVSMVVGIIGVILGFILLVLALFFAPAFIQKFHETYPNGYQYPAQTTQGQMKVAPTSGPIGIKVVLSGPMMFDATNTIFMNGYVAARNIPVSSSDTLTFAVPGDLAPDCDPNEACPQFVLPVTPGVTYGVSVKNSQGLVSTGNFTVTSSSAGKAPNIPAGH